ncbi:hypothetical protein JCM18899A_24000 [Nocardioides sp. AN3]
MVAAPRWFATSPFGPDGPTETVDDVDPALLLVHAKQVGTDRAACDRNAMTWRKHWEPFGSIDPERVCPVCLDVVSWMTFAPDPGRPGA